MRASGVPSRAAGQPKTYVQDRILQQRAGVWQLIETAQ